MKYVFALALLAILSLTPTAPACDPVFADPVYGYSFAPAYGYAPAPAFAFAGPFGVRSGAAFALERRVRVVVRPSVVIGRHQP